MSLDPELAGVMEHVAGAKSFADLLSDPSGLLRLEAFGSGRLAYSPPNVPVHNVKAPGPNGPVGVRVYGGGAKAGSVYSSPGVPGLVWLHGGGFAGGSLDMREADQLARELVHRTGGMVFSVDYRLARKGVHFPVPHHDVLAAWLWATDNAGHYGVNPAMLCLGGASAGANLAVGAAMYLNDIGEPLPARMLLAYPFLHSGLPALNSSDAALHALPRLLRFTADDCRAMVENYIGGPVGTASSYAVPGDADPRGMPPTSVLAAEYDDLRASAERYVLCLREAGVPVNFHIEAGATHGYLNHSAGMAVVQRGLSFLAEELESAKRFQ
ncbi:Acetyl esterase/lipase [Arthrobacter sp. yr096]|uniref:alpha/beta hydrolase fold domain-containing protein n=1 Tax=Arthrobacter sp. yr096 TaxID=1761750 RepID=UPI0008C8717A|nr:alpha/beta hydrolase fold domain-containing protein [Arthrobacter sp. yr096]SEI99538.1 Acetyl esterase/lipase [Arthrobacter sp. yr096]